jgi:hypothetical protein
MTPTQCCSLIDLAGEANMSYFQIVYQTVGTPSLKNISRTQNLMPDKMTVGKSSGNIAGEGTLQKVSTTNNFFALQLDVHCSFEILNYGRMAVVLFYPDDGVIVRLTQQWHNLL